jgi:hypothetical protein
MAGKNRGSEAVVEKMLVGFLAGSLGACAIAGPGMSDAQIGRVLAYWVAQVCTAARVADPDRGRRVLDWCIMTLGRALHHMHADANPEVQALATRLERIVEEQDWVPDFDKPKED